MSIREGAGFSALGAALRLQLPWHSPSPTRADRAKSPVPRSQRPCDRSRRLPLAGHRARLRSAPPRAPEQATRKPDAAKMGTECRSSSRPPPSRRQGGQIRPRPCCGMAAASVALSRSSPLPPGLPWDGRPVNLLHTRATLSKRRLAHQLPQQTANGALWMLWAGSLFAPLHGHVDPAIALGCEFDAAFDQRKQRVIGAHADVGTGVPLRAALAHQNIAGQDIFSAILFHAEAAPCGVAPIARRATCFLVCHCKEFLIAAAGPLDQAPMISLMRTVV